MSSGARTVEEILKALFDDAPGGVYVIDAAFRILSVNKASEPAFREISPVLGRDLAEVLRILWPEPFASEVIGHFRHTLETGEPYVSPMVTEARRNVKRTESYDWQLRRVTLPDGATGVICSFRDLTGIVAAESVMATAAERDKRLMANAAFLAGLGEALITAESPAQVVRILGERVGTFVGASACAFAEIDEGRKEAVVTEEWHRSAGPTLAGPRRLADYFTPDLQAAMLRGEPLVVRDASEDPRIVDKARFATLNVGALLGVPLIRGGAWRCVLGVIHDRPHDWPHEDVALMVETTARVWNRLERARAEARLRDTETRLQQALDASNMGTFLWHVQEDRGEPDARLLRLFGLPADAPKNLASALLRMHPDDRAPYVEALSAASDPGGSGTVRKDIRVLLPDGSIRWLAVTARMVFEGEPRRAVRLVGVVADISDRKRTEEALRESEERLRDADRRKDEFLATLAHELRNPLVPIRTGLELIRLEGDRSDAVGRVRTVMERQVTHMVRLIDDLLDVSRITSGKIQLQRRPTSLGPMIDTAIEANESSFGAAGFDLQVDLPPAPVVLDVDPTRFVQVVSNLLQNAVKFMSSRGHVRILGEVERTAERPAGTLKLTVSDTGIGIEPTLLPRVFDLFAQGDIAGPHAGLGIGLALARRLIEMHGGTIEASSEGPGRGSAFTIRLPVSASPPEPISVAAPAPVPEIGRRVVVIDDSEDIAELVAMLVSDLGGECRIAHDGETGVKVVSEFRPDVVLLDIGMPGIDGYETCRRIRATVGWDVTVIAMTGWGQERDKAAAKAAGFDAHLTKPVDPDTLQHVLADAAPTRGHSGRDATP